ncbi:unnamed protein product [Mesocestoides corti]|uniref:Calmodulin n=1 Tax=Mesocestoides corti TaxID=53468 RepID=A0A0R3U5Y2_MESCO|nr:unnamed protein product [Mesocestoides corti]
MYSRLRRRNDIGRRERLVELFNRMDCNGDRILHVGEVNEYLQRHRYDPSAIREFWRTFDLNQDGQITAEEFNMVLARLPDDSVDIEKLRRVFTSFDTDSSGRLEVNEVMAMLSAIANSRPVVESLMQLHGIPPELGLTFEDFVAFFSDPAFV